MPSSDTTLVRRPHLQRDFVVRRVSITDLDCTPLMSQSSANTERVGRANAGMCHLEGGWDATIDANDIEQTSRYRRRLTYSSRFRRQVQQCATLATMCVRQNNVVDIFEEYWAPPSSGEVRGGDSNTGDDVVTASRLDEYFGDPPSLHVQAVLRYEQTTCLASPACLPQPELC